CSSCTRRPPSRSRRPPCRRRVRSPSSSARKAGSPTPNSPRCSRRVPGRCSPDRTCCAPRPQALPRWPSSPPGWAGGTDRARKTVRPDPARADILMTRRTPRRRPETRENRAHPPATMSQHPASDADGGGLPAGHVLRQVTVPENVPMVVLVGQRDEALRAVERGFPSVDVHVRGNVVALIGPAGEVEVAERLVEELVSVARTGQPLSADA